MSTFPASQVLYRIQSADLAEYLELSDVNDELIVTRPFKESLEQQWIFTPSGANDDTFKVLNAATENLRNPRFLTVITNDKNTVNALGVTNSDTPKTWSIKKTGKDFYTFTCKSSKRNYEVFLVTQDTRETGFLDVKTSNDANFPQNQKWSVLEVTPSVPKDTYRIRTLNGSAIHMKSGSGLVSVEVLEKGKHQEWEVLPMGNGKCTIKSVSETAYLGWEGSKDGFAQIAKTTLPQVWTVRSLGEYTYGVSMSYLMPDKTSITLALSSGKDTEVILKPKKVSYNQIWLFEAVDVSKDDSVDEPPKYEPTTRYPEITAKAYFLRTVGTNQYIYAISSPWRFCPGGRTSQFNLAYVGTGSQFTLAYSTSYYFGLSGDLVVPDDQATTTWILESGQDAQGVKCYYICLASKPSLVLTADTRADINGWPLYTVSQKKNGYTRHQWYFE